MGEDVNNQKPNHILTHAKPGRRVKLARPIAFHIERNIAISAKKPDSDWQEAWMDAIEPTCSHEDAHDLVFRRAGKLPLLPTNGNARLDDYPTPQGADVTEYARSIGYKGKRKVFVSDELVISHNRIEWSDFCENCRESSVSLG